MDRDSFEKPGGGPCKAESKLITGTEVGPVDAFRSRFPSASRVRKAQHRRVDRENDKIFHYPIIQYIIALRLSLRRVVCSTCLRLPRMNRPALRLPPVRLFALTVVLFLFSQSPAYALTLDPRTEALWWLDYSLITWVMLDRDEHIPMMNDSGRDYRVNQRAIERAEVARAELERVGSADDIIAVDALIAAFLLIDPDRRGEGRRLMQATLDRAVARGWDDARANRLLLALAADARRDGDAERAAAFERRAASCAEPCPEDALSVLATDIAAATARVDEIYGPTSKWTLYDRFYRQWRAYLTQIHGPESPQVASFVAFMAGEARRDRPWRALALYQEALDLSAAVGQPALRRLELREQIAFTLLQAGEYHRLVEFATSLAADLELALASEIERDEDIREVRRLARMLVQALRHQARALWWLGGEARAAYDHALERHQRIRQEIGVLSLFGQGLAPVEWTLIHDLVDLEDVPLLERAGTWLTAISETLSDEQAYAGPLILAGLSARAGDYEKAADTLAPYEASNEIVAFQRAYWLERAGRVAEAEALRAASSLDDYAGADPDAQNLLNPRSQERLWSVVTFHRDLGAYEGAAEAAKAYIPFADQAADRGDYAAAQRVWQIAYTLARGGEAGEAFRLMNRAAGIAIRLSFAETSLTDGGSLQLLRRDKFRYLLFIDIAWTAVSGQGAERMTVSSRY